MRNLKMDNKFFEDLMIKYWDGETSLEEERMIKKYLNDNDDHEKKDLKTMFLFFSDEKKIKYEGRINTKTKMIKVNFIRKIAVAASVVLIFGIYFWSNHKSAEQPIASSEIRDPEEALQITKEALAFLAVNYNKGEETITGSISNLQKLEIIKSN